MAVCEPTESELYICRLLVVLSLGLVTGADEPGPPLRRLVSFSQTAVCIRPRIVHCFTTERVPRKQKTLWAVVRFLGSILAMQIYWYRYIRCKTRDPTLGAVDSAKSASAGAPAE